MDPEYPQERLAFMVEDAQVAVLLTQQRLLAGLPKTQARVICLDTDGEQIAQESEGTPVNQATPDNLAYVIYTSWLRVSPFGRTLPPTPSWLMNMVQRRR